MNDPGHHAERALVPAQPPGTVQDTGRSAHVVERSCAALFVEFVRRRAGAVVADGLDTIGITIVVGAIEQIRVYVTVFVVVE